MEKDQLDSLATVAVGSEKIPPPHSHYAPSEVYSSSESPPAYSRPAMKSTAVQIARIIATTLIAISVIIGSFILAAAWLQARATCTPESIAAMQTQLNIQQDESLRRLQPEALIQEQPEAKESLQNLSPPVSVKEAQVHTKDVKQQKNDGDSTKVDNESGDENENDDDYEDPEFPPVHIKLPLQLDLDDLAGTLMQQARSLVSCVVERRRSDEFTDGNDNTIDNNATDPKRVQRLSGERVAILCESGDPRRQEQQEQELLTPIIVPLGPMPVPMQQQEQDYHRYQVPSQFQMPDHQRPPFNFRGMNPVDGIMPPELRNIPQIMEMGLQRQQVRPQMDIRQIPIELRPVPIEMIQGMRPPSDQEQQQHIFPSEQNTYNHDQQPHGMVPPPPPQASQELPREHRMMPQMIIRQQVDQRVQQPQENQERQGFPFQGIPMEIRKIIQQVPLEIKNIIQHITGDSRPVSVPEGARREPVQDFKPFPEARPIPLDSLMLPIEVRNLLEHGNIEGRRQEDSEEQDEQAKPFPGPENQGEEEEKKFPIPADVRSFIHQVVEGRAFPIPRMQMPPRPIETLDVPMEVSARVIGTVTSEDNEEQHQEEQQAPQQAQSHTMTEGQESMEDKRPHYVQPRSVRSIPDALAHPREKRTRRCACDCAC